jgi:NTE family protein
MNQGKDRIGLVLAGGGARGAYEVGVLGTLLPELERRGQRPSVIIGTSVGAVNAAFLAASAHLSAEQAVHAARERWLEIDWGKVVKPLVGPATALAGARYAGAVLGIPGVELNALLDSAPLRSTLGEWIDWDRLHENAASSELDAVAVAATSALSARSVVFTEGRQRAEIDSSHEIDYVEAELNADHVRASAAIPLAFPAVRIESPAAHAGWYFDGGTRLNTPIKPAIDIGVDRVVVIATHSVDPRGESNWHVEGRQPDFGDGLVQLLFAALVDSLIADVRTLGKINLLVAGDGPSELAAGYRRRRGREPHREIPYMFIAPSARDRIGDLAARIYDEHHSGPGGTLGDPEIAILGRLLGGITEPHGELLSYLLFTPEFAAALIEQGRRDAWTWLDREWGSDGPWLREPVDVLAEHEGDGIVERDARDQD